MNIKLKKMITMSINALVIACSLIGCGNTPKTESIKETVKITHNKGETDVPKNPERLVVLDYGSLDIINELNLNDRVVGVPQNGLPSYLKVFSHKKYTNTGGIKEVNFETINELNPDLIIIEGRQADSYDELSKIAPTIYLGGKGNDYLNSLKNNVQILSSIFDKGDEANNKISDIESRIKKLHTEITQNSYNALLTMVSDGSMSVYGKGSRFDLLYNELGFKCTDENIKVSSHGQNISNEYIVSKNPNFLFVLDKGVITGSSTSNAKEIIENKLVKSSDTYKNNHIVYLNAEAWYIGGTGISAVNLMLDDIEKAV